MHASNARPAHVLVADDSAANRELLSSILNPFGYKVTCAEDGEEALAVMRNQQVDLALLDVMMPDLSGIDVCQMMKSTERLREVPVIFLSASDKPGDYGQGRAAGGLIYMAKPIRSAQLLQMVRLYASAIETKETVL